METLLIPAVYYEVIKGGEKSYSVSPDQKEMQVVSPGEHKKSEGETRKGDGIRIEADKRRINYVKLTHNGYINMELIKARKRMINSSLTNKSKKRSRI